MLIGMHNHDINLLKQYSKYHSIAYVCNELVDELFKLSCILFCKQKYKYEIKNDENKIINNVIEYGTIKGSEKPKIKKRKDFKIWTRIN